MIRLTLGEGSSTKGDNANTTAFHWGVQSPPFQSSLFTLALGAQSLSNAAAAGREEPP